MVVIGQVHSPTAFNSGKEPPVSIGYETGGLQSRSGRYGEKEDSLA
jgi:hypothetical protein